MGRIAFRSDLDRSYLGEVERGEVNISIDNFGKIARGLRVAPAALFLAGEEDSPRLAAPDAWADVDTDHRQQISRDAW